jgi:hypothetical protein
MLISIPPKWGDRISEREELDLDCAECGTQGAEFSGPQILGEGYFVSTVGRNEAMIRAYIRNQEMADKQLDQLQLKLSSWSSQQGCGSKEVKALCRQLPIRTASISDARGGNEPHSART